MTKELAGATARFLDVAERQGAHLMVNLNVREHLWPDRRTMQQAIAGLAERASLVKASDAKYSSRHGGRVFWAAQMGMSRLVHKRRTSIRNE